MAELFIKQAQQYSEGRPSYPEELFNFIASKTPCYDLVWDVGTGSGQAAKSLAKLYKSVIATDTSPKQLEFAAKVPNVRYICTSPNMSMSEIETKIGAESSVDLVTIAQSMHWFDLPTFYQQAKWLLKKPNGVIAAWCYTVPEVNRSWFRISAQDRISQHRICAEFCQCKSVRANSASASFANSAPTKIKDHPS